MSRAGGRSTGGGRVRQAAAALSSAAMLLSACAAAGSPDGQARSARTGTSEALPGATALPPELLSGIERRRAELGPAYTPRTRHLGPDGRPRFTNRLILSSSPYLLQHAHNPVNWYPWGDEAFEAAKRLGRPVLLSVGYSTCHWCHVMEEESFEDLEIARFLNERYVAIKVDREERPDVDSVYMTAVQALTGGGGWPMTVWLTPERKPFFGGTYFPARDGDRGAATGFLSLLERFADAHGVAPGQLAEQAARVTQAVEQRLAAGAPGELPGPAVLQAAALFYERRYDAAHGGLAGAPKFPSSLPVRLLLREHLRTGEAKWRDMALKTLERMNAGGMYDHVGGGFHRYSTDERWLVPHFEKMLYDNALLVLAYLEAHQASGAPELSRVAREILRYVERDMTSPDGAFYSATDADSLTPTGRREEGYFFTWTPGELEAALGRDAAQLVAAHYGVTPAGNVEGRSILHVATPLADLASAAELPGGQLAALVAAARETLYRERARRPAPLRDEKILTAWNGLMISAYARAALILGDEGYARSAETAAGFVLRELRREGRLLRSYMNGRAQHNAYLDDYAFLTAGLLDLFEATGGKPWLAEAIALDVVLEAHHEDRERGGFYMTSDDHETLLAREKPGHDGAEPSGNSVALLNLLRLHALTGDDRYRQRAERTLRAFHETLQRMPAALSEMLLAVGFYLSAPKEIVIVTRGGRQEAQPFLEGLRGTFLPAHVLVVVAEGQPLADLAGLVPLVTGKVARDGKPTAYVCERGTCLLPTSDVGAFVQQLRAPRGGR